MKITYLNGVEDQFIGYSTLIDQLFKPVHFLNFFFPKKPKVTWWFMLYQRSINCMVRHYFIPRMKVTFQKSKGRWNNQGHLMFNHCGLKSYFIIVFMEGASTCSIP